MNTITIPKKEYKELVRLRGKLDDILRFVLPREKNKMTGGDLLYLAKLKIKGGPRDLSEKLDLYLYG